ncbi:type II secretion system minor pseudopilin GspJ [Marinobacter sp. S0848L]|uniref:type II secretion system minor pseudopilin GspJ n=1 Tax=Marinobacter sp. S0848L TaxID=2926423 RepID=UPI001FF38635|nr:type II secretion system minor pseudopilin GspJ [Marinobacter sp. S0848L]MCK0107404.1 type II secretion system minor pseudopilin GspJ [Marinobacter sp. S0848L]
MMQPNGFVRAQSGFTLMEMLIAVTITAVIGLGVWQVVSSVVNSRDRVNALAEQFDGLQKTMLLLERDITQVVNRSARDVYGDFKPALTARDDAFELLLTRQGWRNPLGLRRSGLQRAGWEYTGTELRRRYWPVVDQGQDEDSRDVLLLEDVNTFDIRFLDEDGKWHDTWPTDQTMAAVAPGQRPVTPLPIGLEVTLEHERFGEVVRLFTLPDFSQDQAQSVVNQQQEAASEDAEENAQEGAAGGGT